MNKYLTIAARLHYLLYRVKRTVVPSQQQQHITSVCEHILGYTPRITAHSVPSGGSSFRVEVDCAADLGVLKCSVLGDLYTPIN